MADLTPKMLSTSLPMLPLTLLASPRRFRWQACQMAALGALAALGYARLGHQWMLALAAIALWTVAASLVAVSLRRTGLMIDEAGFRLVGTLRGDRPWRAWRHVQHIDLFTMYGTTYVRYQLTPDAPRNHKLGGYLIPFTHYTGYAIESVAYLMETARETFAAQVV